MPKICFKNATVVKTTTPDSCQANNCKESNSKLTFIKKFIN
jgi:hypothetical protein